MTMGVDKLLAERAVQGATSPDKPIRPSSKTSAMKAVDAVGAGVGEHLVLVGGAVVGAYLMASMAIGSVNWSTAPSLRQKQMIA
jgi:microcompartment protein CcmK/EutM